MSPKERHAFAFGYHIALQRARAELCAMTANWDAKVASAQEEARKQTRAMAANFDAEVAALRNDFAEVVRDIHRYRAIERGLDADRNDLDTWLH
jgi:hypothetical protein